MVFYEKMEHQRLGEILIENNLITGEQLKQALSKQKELGLKLGGVLIKLGVVTQDDINWVLHKQFNIPQISLTKDMVDLELIALIPEELYDANFILPLSKSGNELTIVVADPTNFEMLRNLEKLTGFNLNVCIAEVSIIKQIKDDITLVLSDEKQRSKTQLEMVSEPIPQPMILKLLEDSTGNIFFDFVFKIIDDKNLDSLSIIPFEKHILIYFHFYGKHFKKFELPINFYSILISKAKSLISLQADLVFNHPYPFEYTVSNVLKKFKITFFKTAFGTSVKIFNIKKIDKLISLNKQGFSREQLELIYSSIFLEHGIYFILGKEPSISYDVNFSLLGEIASFSKKIAIFDNNNLIDVEGMINLPDDFDPETDTDLPMSIINTINPDLIYFFELITDRHLAQAIKLAYSGKIIIANYRDRSIFRFLQHLLTLGLDPYIVKNSVKFVIHHEKVEELCPKCKRPFNPNMDYVSLFQNMKIEETKFFRKVGCPECNGFGYTNLMDIYEVFKIDNFIRTNMENLEVFTNKIKELKSQGYVGAKEKIMTLIASGSAPFNSIIDIY